MTLNLQFIQEMKLLFSFEVIRQENNMRQDQEIRELRDKVGHGRN